MRANLSNIIPSPQQREHALLSRTQFLHDINLLLSPELKYFETFIVIINFANTKDYEEIITIFGYEFADQLSFVRADAIRPLLQHRPLYHVGVWSVGFIYKASVSEPHSFFLNRVAARLAEPTICRGVPVPFKAGIGICDLKRGLGSTADMLQAAFIACQVSSRSAVPWTECSYDSSHDHRRAFEVLADVSSSLLSLHDFELFYQPRMNLRTMRYCGAEALLRWRHPTLGVISPNEFIPLIEVTGLIRELTHWVLSSALGQAAIWQAAGLIMTVAVNISMKNFNEADLVERIEALLQHYKVAPKQLVLEFSDTSALPDMDIVRPKISRLREIGVGIAIEDFGIGRNSLAYVGVIPAGTINIEGSLIAGLRDNLRSQAVVKAMIGLAHELGMTVVGKSIEFEASLERLVGLSCDFGQGYLFSRPMAVEEFTQWSSMHFI